MDIEVKIDPACPAAKLILVTPELTEEQEQLLRRLSGETPRVLTGLRDGTVTVLDPAEVVRVYAGGGKVFAVTGDGEYTLRLRLIQC